MVTAKQAQKNLKLFRLYQLKQLYGTKYVIIDKIFKRGSGIEHSLKSTYEFVVENMVENMVEKELIPHIRKINANTWQIRLERI